MVNECGVTKAVASFYLPTQQKSPAGLITQLGAWQTVAKRRINTSNHISATFLNIRLIVVFVFRCFHGIWLGKNNEIHPNNVFPQRFLCFGWLWWWFILLMGFCFSYLAYINMQNATSWVSSQAKCCDLAFMHWQKSGQGSEFNLSKREKGCLNCQAF